MTLPGQHVTQYMYVLFDQVHIYIQKPQFTFGFVSKTSREFAQSHINLQNVNVIGGIMEHIPVCASKTVL